MKRTILLLTAASVVLPTVTPAQQRVPDAVLRFEASRDGGLPSGWAGGPAGTVAFDSTVVHAGAGAARLERNAQSMQTFSVLTKTLPVDFDGQSIELRGYLRTEGVTGFAGLWLREDGTAGPVQFDNMQDRGLAGTTEWTEYAVRLPLDAEAREILFGVLLVGEGTLWADDLQLLVDGRPINDAPTRVRARTVLDEDEEFADGSSITVSSLTSIQADHLAVLGMVWGFLKYHHPRVAAGELHWDFELFRVLPLVLAAPDRPALQRVLADWIDRIGVPQGCDPCAAGVSDAHLLPPLAWIEDVSLLGEALSRRLQSIHANRFAGDRHFYVSLVPGVGNPAFEHELPYPGQHPPDAGYRMLALFRYWSAIEYWFPYRNLLDDDWHAELRDVLPRFVAASDWDAYRLALLALIARVHDTHANLWGNLDVRPPRGSCAFPVSLRFVEGRVAVTAIADTAWGAAAGLEVGDVITAVDGRPIDSLVAEWSPYYAASNQATRLRDIARALPAGACGEGSLDIERRGRARTLTAQRTRAARETALTHDRPGDTFQLLSRDVAYLKLSGVAAQDIAEYLQRAAGTRGLVIDIRNYPSAFVVFALGSRLVDAPTPFARFTHGNLDNPGAFTWTPPISVQPQAPHYAGTVVILVDEVSISQAEYTAMAFRAAPGALVVGSTTAAADGNVSQIILPGGIRTLISGIGVFYPDKTPTQRIGIVPDVVVTPTIAGIREDRDEVLEEAVRQILGAGADESDVRRITRRP